MTTNTKQTELIDDYLSSRLSEADLDAFEERLLFDTELQNEVITQKQIREDLKHLEDEIRPAKTEDKNHSAVKQEPFWLKIHTILSSPSWAYAATFLLLIGFTWRFIPGEPLNESGTRQSNSDYILYVEQLRNNASVTPLQIEPEKQILLSFDALELVQQPVRFRLYDGEILLFDYKNLMPNNNLLALPPLGKGMYRLQIQASDLALEYQINAE